MHEIDELEDWIIIEKLLKLKKQNIKSLNKIKLFLSDIDGTLTDSGMYYDDNGIETKKFSTRDGMGFEILRNNNILTGLITSEISKIVDMRARKLKINFIVKGAKGVGKLDEVKIIAKKNNIKLNEIAYVGDDINCISLLNNVGIAACPSDAHDSVRNIPGIRVLSRKGGCGAVREFIDAIIMENVI
tara:strand:- start:1233 stop:1793 length:561 start_codon:yes stop_codon:yes gene_type:complete